MNHLFRIILMSTLSLSCCESSPILMGADYIEITFYGKTREKIDYKYKRLTFKTEEEVSKIAGFITGRSAPLYKCGYTGSISIFRNKKSILENAEFNLLKDCSHIVFIINSKLISRRISPEGLFYLRGLYKRNVKKKYWLIEK